MRWPGWLVIALAATSARAQPATSPHDPAPLPLASKIVSKLGAKAAAKADAETRLVLVEVKAEKVEAKPDAKAEAKPDAKDEAKPDAKAAKHPASDDPFRPIESKEQKSLTDDPVFGNADKINGASVEDIKGYVAFTFDDGPVSETTPIILEALHKYDIPATFFIVTRRITGKRGEAARQLLHKEIEAGFTIGSHSVDHANLRHAKTEQLNREVDSSVRTLSVEVGQPIAMFRPPYGALSSAGKDRLNKLGLTEVLWSIDPADWKSHDADKLRKKVVSTIEQDGGGVILMHDAKPLTAKIIADIFDDLEAENCARLAAKRDPILPVSLHYFLKDDDVPRAIPEAVQKRTAAYKAALPGRCANRPVAPADESITATEPAKQAAK